VVFPLVFQLALFGLQVALILLEKSLLLQKKLLLMHLVLFLGVDSYRRCGWRPSVTDGNGLAVIEIIFVQSVFRDTKSGRWSPAMLHAIGCSLLLFLRNRNILMYCRRRFSINSVGCEHVTLFKLQVH
jgi:hypothetical protein|tara:strand:- start:119 stop:502 length:384 start_codon:yes stop_codon:yes gene_type:complete